MACTTTNTHIGVPKLPKKRALFLTHLEEGDIAIASKLRCDSKVNIFIRVL